MKNSTFPLLLGALLALPCSAYAAKLAAHHARNRLLIGPRLGFEIKADFSPSGLGAVDPGPPTGGAVHRTYQDGYVGVDVSGNAGDQTWNWGYEHPGQVDTAAGTLNFTASTGDRPLFQDVADDPQVGAEAIYQRLLGAFGGAEWGGEIGVTWLPLDLRNTRGFSATWTSITDAYPLNAITPPAAPFHGSAAGPSPAIGSVPTRTTLPQNVNVSGDQRIQSQMFGVRIGPMLDVPLGEPLSLQLSGGLLVNYAHTEFSHREQAAYPDGSVRGTASSTTTDDWSVGGYLRGQVIVYLSRRLGLFGAAEYQALPDLDLQTGPWAATLRMGGAVYGSGGVMIQF